MWTEILGWALLVSLNPMLLGAIVLVISRPRPVQNLLAFWVGCVIVNVPALLIPLVALHSVPSFAALAQELATPDPTSGIQPLQLGTGVLALCLAVLILVRSRVRQRVPARSASGGDSSVLVLDSDESEADSRPPGRFRRLLGRARDEWDNGALWVSMVLALIYVLPPPLILLIDTVIVGSGTSIGTQIVAVLVFVAVMFAVFEITLISYMLVPAKTQAVLDSVHGWALVHRTQVLIVLFFLVGIWQVLTGLGIA
ncbi:GAP family protein [Mycolicibacterium mageritense]|uniref:GAP family protein n=1 Tax=Mycolicibacterium mageritense TaxID=53462 RepID=UPI001E4D9C59|nr:GAP family protein [Mycolicibacterium mageritense]GJJ22832.1 hypothetical protein MTY414_65050 [Mycolicibacterium mageritense]